MLAPARESRQTAYLAACEARRRWAKDRAPIRPNEPRAIPAAGFTPRRKDAIPPMIASPFDGPSGPGAGSAPGSPPPPSPGAGEGAVGAASQSRVEAQDEHRRTSRTARKTAKAIRVSALERLSTAAWRRSLTTPSSRARGPGNSSRRSGRSRGSRGRARSSSDRRRGRPGRPPRFR